MNTHYALVALVATGHNLTIVLVAVGGLVVGAALLALGVRELRNAGGRKRGSAPLPATYISRCRDVLLSLHATVGASGSSVDVLQQARDSLDSLAGMNTADETESRLREAMSAVDLAVDELIFVKLAGGDPEPARRHAAAAVRDALSIIVEITRAVPASLPRKRTEQASGQDRDTLPSAVEGA